MKTQENAQSLQEYFKSQGRSDWWTSAGACAIGPDHKFYYPLIDEGKEDRRATHMRCSFEPMFGRGKGTKVEVRVSVLKSFGPKLYDQSVIHPPCSVLVAEIGYRKLGVQIPAGEAIRVAAMTASKYWLLVEVGGYLGLTI